MVVGSTGLEIHTHPLANAFWLELADLTLISAIDAQPGGAEAEFMESSLVRVAKEYAVEEERPRKLIDRLMRMKLLVPISDPAPSVAEAPTVSPPTEAPESPLDLESWLVLPRKFVMRCRGGRYEFIENDGRVGFDLSPVETSALATLGTPTTSEEAFAKHRVEAGDRALDADAFDSLLRKLHHHHLLSNTEEPEARTEATRVGQRFRKLARHFQPHARAQDVSERERVAKTGKVRTRVIPVAWDTSVPLGIGVIMAYAENADDGRLTDHYEFRRDWIWAPDRFEVFTARPAVYLFSNYLWSHGRNAELSARVKAASPTSVTIHGGPDTPRYREDVERYFAENPHVDITVHGEGERTTVEILDHLTGAWEDEDFPDLSTLKEVRGISFRLGTEIVHTDPRERIKDLDTIPSPLLTGMFDAYSGVEDLLVTLETNRGCPYGCTFCDWGAATMTKIRKYDLERVFDEIRWCGENGVRAINLADANFGIFPRDVEIAREVGRVRTETGHPVSFSTSYAKNSIKHITPILEALRGAGIVCQGVLSLQSADPNTLTAIKRSNIKTEKYDQLAQQIRDADLPLTVELMLGLPGSTLESFKNDLQQAIDRELVARIHPTNILINSPMNAPAYRKEFGIEADKPHGPSQQPMLVATKSFTREDHRAMMALRRHFLFFEHFGTLRLVSRFVRQELGLREIDFFERLITDIRSRPEYPLLGVFANTGWGLMVPPVSWRLLFDELRHYMVHVLGAKDDSALETILEAQTYILPAAGRSFPRTRSFEHDVSAWYEAIRSAKIAAPGADWTETVPHLSEFGPVELTIDDPGGTVQNFLGTHIDSSAMGATWEFDSPVARRMVVDTDADW